LKITFDKLPEAKVKKTGATITTITRAAISGGAGSPDGVVSSQRRKIRVPPPERLEFRWGCSSYSY
jgi:hypothetical protein